MEIKYLSKESVKELLIKCYTRLIECEGNIVRFETLCDEKQLTLNKEIVKDLSDKIEWVEGWYEELGGDDATELYEQIKIAIIQQEKAKYLELQSFIYSFESIIAHNDSDKDKENIEKIVKRKEESEKEIEAIKTVIDYFLS